jgi:hypothetical protein
MEPVLILIKEKPYPLNAFCFAEGFHRFEHTCSGGFPRYHKPQGMDNILKFDAT